MSLNALPAGFLILVGLVALGAFVYGIAGFGSGLVGIPLIGGMGTLYGAVIGSVLFVLAQNYLQDLLRLAAGAVEGVPVLAAVLTPDRWLLWLGVLFVP